MSSADAPGPTPGRSSRLLAPRPAWLRVVCIPVGLVLLVVSLWILGLAGVPSASGGWLPTAVGAMPALLLLLLGAGLGPRWWVSLLAAALLAVAIGTWDHRTSPPDPERLTEAAEAVGTPDGWRQIEARSGGSTWGLFGDWPHYDAVYASTDPVDQAADAYTALLEADGWQRAGDDAASPPAGVVRQTWHRDRWWLTLTVEAPNSPWREYDTTVPASETKISIHIDY